MGDFTTAEISTNLNPYTNTTTTACLIPTTFLPNARNEARTPITQNLLSGKEKARSAYVRSCDTDQLASATYMTRIGFHNGFEL